MNTVLLVLVLLFLLVFVGICIVILVSLITKSLFNGAYFAETSNDRMKDIFSLARLSNDDTLLDIGSGDGRIVLAAAKRGIRATGIEINPLLVIISKLKIALTYPKLLKNPKIKHGDLWKFKTTPYSVVVIYGLPFMFERLEKKLKKELKPGSRVLSVMFEFPNWKKKQKKGEIFLYEM